MRKPYIAANWKMHMTVSEANGFLDAFLPQVSGVNDVDIAIAPPFTALDAVGRRLSGTNVKLAAQNVFFEEKGAFTGEVAPGMLKDIGCDSVIIGHSERRQYFGESNNVINRKLKAAVKNGLEVIFCIGETKEEREAGNTFEVLSVQTAEGLRDVPHENLVVAYEPVWAIGTGLTATVEQAQDAHLFVRRQLAQIYGDAAETIRILYGGSVKPDNVDSLMACPDVDGALVGGAALMADSFARIVKFNK